MAKTPLGMPAPLRDTKCLKFLTPSATTDTPSRQLLDEVNAEVGEGAAEPPGHASDAGDSSRLCGDADSVNADNMSLFPAEQPQIVNRFTNHNELLYDEGYNSKGNLYFLGEGMYDKYKIEKTIGD